jgi:CRP-like cAMP-binding protein
VGRAGSSRFFSGFDESVSHGYVFLRTAVLDGTLAFYYNNLKRVVGIPTLEACMENYFPILCQCPLFQGIGQEDLNAMLGCLGAKFVSFSKGDPVFLEGEPARLVGVVLSGSVQVVQDDYYGNRSVLSILQAGDSFGEAFSCAGLVSMPVSVFAVKNSEVILLNCQRILTLCSHTCHFHSLLVQNIVKGLAQKNLAFTQKVRYMSQKTTREKLLAYLFDQAKQQGRAEFVIPCDRQALADYLGVERTAMSAEISKLKKAGLLDTKGSWFCLNRVDGEG